MKNSTKINTLSLQGMHCGSCVSKVTKVLMQLADEVKVTLNPPTAQLTNCTATIQKINAALAKAGDYQASTLSPKPEEAAPKKWLVTYQPLFIILAYIVAVSLLIEVQYGAFAPERWMMHFMAGFFLVFSFFKMLNIRAFANSYAMYDLLAVRSKPYGFMYPFIELALGLAYLLNIAPNITNTVTLSLMAFSSIGVIRAVMSQQKIRCACLGTVFELPMSTITIIEDLLMAGMAAWMLI
jgi:copper chaperone CopZ